MPVLIVQLGSARHVIPIDGEMLVGRDESASLPIDHPTVSRRHARFELVDNTCWIEDLGSRNGTRVNGQPLRGRAALSGGERIRIGHVPCWYFETAPDQATIESLNHRRSDGSGFSFRCECGVRLWAASVEIASSLPCPACGSRSHAVVAPESLTGGANDATGATPVCGVCQWPVKPGESQVSCPTCHARYHSECWTENHGCSVYGCDQVNVLTGPATTEDASPTGSADFETPEVIAAASASIGPALLAGSVVAGLLGLLLFGVPTLLTFVVTLLARRSAGPRWTIAAALLSLLGIVSGTLFSGWWWLNWSMDGLAGR